ncbi:hypothetical protein KQX54_017531 [Cotesia glomerata]|uniref:Uncharacterized protein n=1 Tax=Cotesia glomerata TaxID=32391 RepID=A0AAV7J177_COTGL|nr:hypothetical protein KQX54_017531 [Cotesia glomerata]
MCLKKSKIYVPGVTIGMRMFARLCRLASDGFSSRSSWFPQPAVGEDPRDLRLSYSTIFPPRFQSTVRHPLLRFKLAGL